MRSPKNLVTMLLSSVVCALTLVPGVASAQGPLTNGGNHTASISSVGELDTWTFSAALGDYVVISIGEKLPAGPDPGFTPSFRLQRPDGVQIASAAHALADRIGVTAPLTGTYTVIVSDYYGNKTGNYVLHLVKTPGTLIVPAGDEGGPMTNGANHAGRIGAPAGQPIQDDPADQDPWTFTASKDDYLIVSVGEKLISETDPGFTPYILLIGPNGTVLASDAHAVAARFGLRAPLSGTYTVLVLDYYANKTGDYIVHLVKAPGTITVPTGDEGGPMTNGANHAGRIGAVAGQDITEDPGDQDPWTFAASKDDYLIVSVGEKLTTEIDPGFTPYILLIGPDGTVLASDAEALAARVGLRAPLTGTYTVLVLDYYANKTGDYIVHLVKAPGTITVPTGDEGGPMTNGANHAGRIGAVAGQDITDDPGDQDPWTITASKDDYLVISVGEKLTTETDPGFTPYILLIGPDGTVLASDAQAVAARVGLRAPLTGTYTVLVLDYYANKTGDYILHLVQAPGALTVPAGDEGGPMTSTVQNLGRIGAITGEPIAYDPGDQDPWTFRANAGNTFSISIGEVFTSQIDPGFTPYILLIGPNGAVVASATGAVDAQIANRVATLTGRYTLIVLDYYANKTGSYRLTLVCPTCPADVDPFTVTPSVVGNGTITPSAPQSVQPNQTTGFTLAPAAGYQLSAVTGTCGGALLGLVFTTAPVTANCTVVANFVLQTTFTVTPSAGANGTINPSTPQTVTSGQTRSFTLAPTAGFQVDAVTGTCGGNLVGLVFTTNAVVGNCTVHATFKALTLPTMSLDKTSLRFGAVTNGPSFVYQTPAQIVRLTQVGAGAVTWTATPSQPWLQMTPATGTGSANLSFSVVPVPGLPTPGPTGASVDASVTFTFTGASNNPGPITVALNLRLNGQSTLSIGVVDTPLNNRTGVTGAVPFTGWAVDDVGVTRVMVCRSAFGGEVAPVDPNCGGAAQIFVGFAVSIDGARPDVAAAYPTYPANTIAGWGFMVLTNMLPNQGNGTYLFHMYAQDVEGHTTLLGTRTMSCANALATLPFGAIDTPAQGGVASGNAYVNFGWALTPQPKTIPVNGSTITVLVDGVSQGSADYNHFRPDIGEFFPGFNNTAGAIGFKVLDTTTLANGTHTIVWVVTDDQGVTEGIGSRFFTVANGASAVTATEARATAVPAAVDVAALPMAKAPVVGRRGFDLAAPFVSHTPTGSGRVIVRGEEIDRFELALGAQTGVRYTGYLRTGETLAALPIGSSLDAATGVFTWAPGVGFIGTYDFVFVRSEGATAIERQEVRIVLHPKGRGAVGPQVVIDVPGSQQQVTQPFMLAGWAADLHAASGTGMATLHVWAYPLAGGPPVFVGAADTGGRRPDVATVYGGQFEDAGYGLVVNGLAPGTYDLAVFGYSTVTGDFVPAKVVRVTVR